MSRIKEPILIVRCPVCDKNEWDHYGGKQYLCSNCGYKLDISRKDNFQHPI